jgi:hypothetical protein
VIVAVAGVKVGQNGEISHTAQACNRAPQPPRARTLGASALRA